jgi:hypothetical protein
LPVLLGKAPLRCLFPAKQDSAARSASAAPMGHAKDQPAVCGAHSEGYGLQL